MALSTFPDDQPQGVMIAELNGLHGPGSSAHCYLHYLVVDRDRLAHTFTFLGR